VLIAVNGYFGERLADMAGRYGAAVDRVERPWGEVFDPDQIESALQSKPYKLVALVHAETSTGALQPHVADIAAAAHRHGALLILDTVTSLGGIPVEIDAWDVDVAYSGTQKCLSCPPGLAPITVGPRARSVLRNRRTRVANWYLDLSLVEKYWGSERTYHHTAPISMNYALREALRLIAEEGLESRFARHRAHAEELWVGLEQLGLALFVAPENRLPTLTTCRLAQSSEEAIVRRRLLDGFNIEIAGGLGPLKGKVWRIGLMGYSSRRENIACLLAALGNILE
jgi:alanine-glyoxylate transaminase/serine-glyoxylate transaminase/serine-pyruvate transaminase